MQALLPLPPGATLTRLPEVELEGHAPAAVSVQVATLPGGTARALRLQLPALTPPGNYAGVVRLPEGERSLTVEVDANPRLVAGQAAIELTASPGEEAEIELEVANIGNVAYEVPDRYGFGLFDVQGVERSLSAGFTAPVQGVDRVALIADELAASHGGLALVRILEGSGSVEPGDARTLRGTLRVGHDIVAGRTYFGYLVVQEGKCTVNVRITVPALREVQ